MNVSFDKLVQDTILDVAPDTPIKDAKMIADNLKEIFTNAVNGLKPEDTITWNGIFKIECVQVPDRNVRNPQTGTTSVKPAHEDLKIKLLKIRKDFKEK